MWQGCAMSLGSRWGGETEVYLLRLYRRYYFRLRLARIETSPRRASDNLRSVDLPQPVRFPFPNAHLVANYSCAPGNATSSRSMAPSITAVHRSLVRKFSLQPPRPETPSSLAQEKAEVVPVRRLHASTLHRLDMGTSTRVSGSLYGSASGKRSRTA